MLYKGGCEYIFSHSQIFSHMHHNDNPSVPIRGVFPAVSSFSTFCMDKYGTQTNYESALRNQRNDIPVLDLPDFYHMIRKYAFL